MATIPITTKKEIMIKEKEIHVRESKLLNSFIIAKLEDTNSRLNLKIRLNSIFKSIDKKNFCKLNDPNMIKFFSLLDIISRIENKRILRRTDLIKFLGTTTITDSRKLESLISNINKKRFTLLQKMPDFRKGYFHSRNQVLFNEMENALLFHDKEDSLFLESIKNSVNTLIKINYQITSLELVTHSLIYTLEESTTKRRDIINKIESSNLFTKKQIFNASFRLKTVLNL